MPRLVLITLLCCILLTACGSSDEPTQTTGLLESITVTDADGHITARTTLDYASGKLVRVRAEEMTAGPDGENDTTDDVLGLVAVADCQIETDGNAVHDSYAEAHGISPVSIFFSAFQDCALPGLAASSIKSKAHAAGADGKLLTADDTTGLEFTLKRTGTGSRYTSPLPDSTLCEVNCTGLDDIIYNPYEGLDPDGDGIYQVDNLYTTDSSARIQSIGSDYAETVYTRNADGLVLQREFLTQPTAFPPYYPEAGGDIMPTQIEEYEVLAEGKTAIHQSILMPSDVYDSLSASPNGQRLLLVLFGIGEKPPVLASDGLSYYHGSGPHYRMEKTGNRLDRITRLDGIGEDGIWNSNDDVPGPRVTLEYSTP